MPNDYVSAPIRKLLRILALLAVMQWVVIVPAMLESGVFSSLDCWIDGSKNSVAAVCPGEVTPIRSADKLVRAKPFRDDFFFWSWNVYPILLFLSFMLSNSIFSTHQGQIKSGFKSERPIGGLLSSSRLRSGWLVLLVASGITGFAVWAQINKQNLFTANGEYLYWWDYGISQMIYGIRLFFVATNVLLISLVLWISFWWLMLINRTVRLTSVQPVFTDPQQAFGFRPFANFLISLILPWFIALTIGLLGWLDHKGLQGMANLFGTIGLGVAAIVGVYLIARPIYAIHIQLHSQKLSSLEKFTIENKVIDDVLGNQPGSVSVSLVEHVDTLWQSIELAKHIQHSRTWPVPGVFGFPLLLGLSGPFLGSFGISSVTLVRWLISIF